MGKHKNDHSHKPTWKSTKRAMKRNGWLILVIGLLAFVWLANGGALDNIFDGVFNVIGAFFGLIGALIGGIFAFVFGVIGLVFGVVFGVIGAVFGIIGAVFGAIFSVIGTLFGLVFGSLGLLMSVIVPLLLVALVVKLFVRPSMSCGDDEAEKRKRLWLRDRDEDEAGQDWHTAKRKRTLREDGEIVVV